MFSYTRLVAFAFSTVFAVSLVVTPASAQTENPIQAFKDAFNKAKQQAKPPAKPAPQTPAQPPAPAAPQPGAAPATPEQAAADPQAAAAPWTPPADDSASAAPVNLDPSKMPDVVGVRLGMTAAEAVAAVKKQYPTDIYQKMTVTWWPDTQKPDYGYTVLTSAPGNAADVHLSFTAPPGPQVLWHMVRFTYKMNINHATMLAALRAKYGKETVALNNNSGQIVTNDTQISDLYWLYNEKGERVSLPPSTAFPNSGLITECPTSSSQQPVMPANDSQISFYKGWCTSMVALRISISTQEIVENTYTEITDVPLAIRSEHASAVWQANLAAEQQKKAIDKSKTVTPVL
jgi:hypothetical protein